MNLTNIATEIERMPSRILLFGKEGIGKTSLWAYSDRPVFIMARGETGLVDLKGQIPDTPHFKDDTGAYDLQSFFAVNEAVRALQRDKHDYKTLVIDSLGRLESLIVDQVVANDCDGDMTKFEAYGRGYNFVERETVKFIAELDRLWSRNRMTIVLLAHAQIQTFKNPEGVDYDRYSVNVHKKMYGPIAAWVKELWFMHSPVEVTKDVPGAAKGKGTGGKQNYLYTQGTAAFDAKSRSGLPPRIKLGASAQESYQIISEAMKKGAGNGNQPK